MLSSNVFVECWSNWQAIEIWERIKNMKIWFDLTSRTKLFLISQSPLTVLNWMWRLYSDAVFHKYIAGFDRSIAWSITPIHQCCASLVNLCVLSCSCFMTRTVNACNSGSTGSLDIKETNCELLQTLSALPSPQPALSSKWIKPTTLLCKFTMATKDEVVPAKHTITPPPYSLSSRNPLDSGQTFTQVPRAKSHAP